MPLSKASSRSHSTLNAETGEPPSFAGISHSTRTANGESGSARTSRGAHGFCAGDGRCVCDPGWSGAACEVSVCLGAIPGAAGARAVVSAHSPAPCAPHGLCMRRRDGAGHQCRCDPGWRGPDCMTRVCVLGCSGHGVCNNGTCLCAPGFHGRACEQPSCTGSAGRTKGCNGRGECVEGICACVAGWGGGDCSERRCPRGCEKNGVCRKDGVCECLVGWGGGPIFRHGARGHAPRAVVQKTLGGLRRARLVACGPRHAVVALADGTVFTWGAGARGRLGHGDCRGQTAPKRVEGLPDGGIISVAAGGAHTAVVVAATGQAAGALYIWGDDRGGQLGQGSGEDDDQPVKRETRKAAIPKQNDADFSTAPAVVEFFQWRGALIRHVACGLHHTLAVAWEPASAGAGVVVARLYAWGFGDRGRLGTGATGAQKLPARVLLPICDDPHSGHVVAAAGAASAVLASADGRLKPGHLIALSALGGGFAWGSALLRL